jgi:hypothetical protein
LRTGRSPLEAAIVGGGGGVVGEDDAVVGEADAALADGVPAFAAEVGVPAPVTRPPQPEEATAKAAMMAASTRLIPVKRGPGCYVTNEYLA